MSIVLARGRTVLVADTAVHEMPSSEELAEIKELKAKVRRLEQDNEILRQASIFFAGELDPRDR